MRRGRLWSASLKIVDDFPVLKVSNERPGFLQEYKTNTQLPNVTDIKVKRNWGEFTCTKILCGRR